MFRLSTGEVSFEPSLHRVKYSLGHMLQVPLEVAPGNSTLLEENSQWIITAGLHAHYHRLSMGDGVTFCVLAGSIETNWKSGEKEKIVSSLHPECTGSYSAGFSMAANVKVNGKQHQIDNTKKGAAWLLTLTTDKKLALWAKSPPTANVTLSLGGVVLASKSSGQPRSGLGRGSNLGEGDGSAVEGLSPEAFELSRVARNGSPEMSRQLGESGLKTSKLVVVGPTDLLTRIPSTVCKAWRSQGLCNGSKKRTFVRQQCREECAGKGLESHTRPRINMTQADMPTNASIVTTPTNLIITGKHLNNRTCSLRGVVTFQSMNESAQAQLDPNLRDLSMTPYCFPMAAQIFIAGVVKDNNSTNITRHVAVQIEPHGRLRVVGEEPQDINVRLDGISYAPWMPFSTPPSDCVGLLPQGEHRQGR